MRKSLSYVILSLSLWAVSNTGCKRPYAPPAIQADNRFLAVDGILVNSPDSPSVFTLSRTTRLTDTLLFSPETGAQVSVEGSTGDNFVFTEEPNGIYKAAHLILNNAAKYRLKIITATGDQFQSDYVDMKQTPSIDSISWQQQNDVTVYSNTHDPSNNTLYYRWSYVETWQYKTKFDRTISEKNGIIFYVDATTQTSNCWSSAISSNILVGSSIALSQDIISKEPIAIIPQNSEKIGIRYSILVKQYAITEQAYQYFQVLKKNTEELGSIFDAQPTQLTGNIHCTNNPTEIAVGFFTAASVSEKRIFIKKADVTNWNPVDTGESCDIVKIPQDPNNYLLFNYSDPAFEPYYFESMPPLIVLTKRSCVDCTVRGGTSQTPSFW